MYMLCDYGINTKIDYVAVGKLTRRAEYELQNYLQNDRAMTIIY